VIALTGPCTTLYLLKGCLPWARADRSFRVPVTGNQWRFPVASVLAGALLCTNMAEASRQAPAPPPRIADLRQSLDVMVGRLLPADGLVRSDGYVYAIDIGLLALSAALSADRNRYEELIAVARRRFIQRSPGIGARPARS
jgi:hypothetical protein